MSKEPRLPKGAPINFLQPGETITNLPVSQPTIPVVRMVMQPALPSSPSHEVPGSNRYEITALIDTGAAGVYIDEDFAKQHGFISERTTTVHSAAATTIEPVYPALFELPESSSHYRQSAEFVSVPLRKHGRSYDAVLGMQFLSNGILLMDFDSNTFRFEFTTKPNK
ncbi:retroviral-like aspartic protease [Pantoea sp. Ap-967]|uniref:retropepsin-like aspartic protease n=1 Tax=Pantoea sp. Ap-967 TaxID=2608362 RepID=UPI00141F73E4|nr:retropepsin-like aspartic protease [Pantoea sp. Ap-967]NIE72989.1 retroviral-like aspartic protease [Pantoea sp. Ap-967]